AETEYAAFRAGAHGYLPKTASLPVLIDVLRAACNQHGRGFITYRNGELLTTAPAHPDTRLTAAKSKCCARSRKGCPLHRSPPACCAARKPSARTSVAQ